MADAVSTACRCACAQSNPRALPRMLTLLFAASLGAAALAAGMVDPTQPPPGYGASQHGTDAKSSDTPAAPEPVRLQMIAHDGASHLAVLNGRRVRPGDTIKLDGKSVKVAAIRDDSVVLEREGQRQVVDLMPHVGVRLVCAAHSPDRPSCRNDTLGASQ
jgi:hypothetical protein